MKNLIRPLPLSVAVALCSAALSTQAETSYFQRIAVFPVCQNIQADCNTDTETVAEIVVASDSGKTLVYTDSAQEQLGLVDISSPSEPKPAGTIALNGEPTSVDVQGKYAFVAVNTSSGDILPGTENADSDLKFMRDMSGELAVINIHTHQVIQEIPLSGQPDSVAISPNGQHVAIVIENERDEEVCVGGTANAQPVPEDDEAAEQACESGGGEIGIPGQGPAGTLDIVDLSGKPGTWEKRTVELAGLADLFPADPEPEYVDINKDNTAVITFQENNHAALIDLTTGDVLDHFPLGTVDLTNIDTKEEDPALISLTNAKDAVLKEPDGVSWINRQIFATADEGDLDGGSRGFSIYDETGTSLFNSGNENDHLAVRVGHYPDDRSKNKGNEPENVDYVEFDDGSKLLVVASERASILFVYDVTDPAAPEFLQVLPAGKGPEGIKAIPSRHLLVAASEVDDRGDKVRSVVNIYQHGFEQPNYPTVQSTDRPDSTPIPWGALSGLAAYDNQTVYSLHDSFYQQSRIFKIDLSNSPALIDQEIVIRDDNDVLANISVTPLADPTVDATDSSRKNVFDEADLDELINDDKTVNLDPEGIALATGGGFWVASEGAGTIDDAKRPVNTHNLIIKTAADGVITEVIRLPESLNDIQLRFGLEGIAEYDSKLYLAFQRAWGSDSNPRIGVYDTTNGEWKFFFYPLDAPVSQHGGWVGLSEITSLGNGEFMVIERDNQAGPDAAIKRLYKFDTNGMNDGDTLSKVLVDDLMNDLSSSGGLVLEKVEGAAILPNGDILIVNDNDGVDDSNGETQLINLGKIL